MNTVTLGSIETGSKFVFGNIVFTKTMPADAPGDNELVQCEIGESKNYVMIFNYTLVLPL